MNLLSISWIWKGRMTGRVNIRSKRGFVTLSTMVSCYAPWSKSILEEPFQKLFQLLNHHEKILVMMNFSKKVFPRVTQVSIKASSWQSSAACKTSYCHQSSKQANPCVWVSLNSTAANKTIDSCLWKSCWYHCHSSQYDKNNSCSFSKFIKLIVISSFISSDFLRDKIYYL